MKGIIRILVMQLSLLLLLTSPALATEQGPNLLHHLQFNRIALETNTSTVHQKETPSQVLDQVARFFNSERGLAINDTTSILLLCNQTNPLEDSDDSSEILSNLGVGLKIKF